MRSTAVHVTGWPGNLRNWLWQRLPGCCVLCGFRVRGITCLCTGCRSRLPYLMHPCHGCGIALPADARLTRCGSCQLQPPVFDACFGVFDYRPPLDRLISAFKFRSNLATGRVLGQLLAEAFVAHYATEGSDVPALRPTLITPVPLHPSRLKARGFNQAALLARPVAGQTGIPFSDQLVIRNRNTAAQSQLGARQRRSNLRGAFRPGRANPGLNLSHVVLIDDVVTTSTTVAAVTDVLKNLGAERVDIWAVARASPDAHGISIA